METRPANRPVWPFILGAVLLLLLIVLVARSCRDDYGETPPPFGDTLDIDTMMVPPPMEDGDGTMDTGMNDTTPADDTLAPVVTPPTSGGSPGMPSGGSSPAVNPGGTPGM